MVVNIWGWGTPPTPALCVTKGVLQRGCYKGRVTKGVLRRACCKGRLTKGVFGGESDASGWMIQARFEGDSEAIRGRFKGDSGTFRAIRVLGHVSYAGPSSGGGRFSRPHLPLV